MHFVLFRDRWSMSNQAGYYQENTSDQSDPSDPPVTQGSLSAQ